MNLFQINNINEIDIIIQQKAISKLSYITHFLEF